MSSELDRLAGGGCGQAGSGEGVRAVTDEVLDAAAQTGADASQTVAEHIQLAANHSALPAGHRQQISVSKWSSMHAFGNAPPPRYYLLNNPVEMNRF